MSRGGSEDVAIYDRKAQKGSREEELNFSQRQNQEAELVHHRQAPIGDE